MCHAAFTYQCCVLRRHGGRVVVGPTTHLLDLLYAIQILLHRVIVEHCTAPLRHRLLEIAFICSLSAIISRTIYIEQIDAAKA